MALSVHKPFRKDSGPVRTPGRRSAKVDRYPWYKITRSKEKHAAFTMWIGAKTIVIRIRYPDGRPKDSRIAITGNRLQVRSNVQDRRICQSIALPCPVQAQPILIIEDGQEAMYILVLKK